MKTKFFKFGLISLTIAFLVSGCAAFNRGGSITSRAVTGYDQAAPAENNIQNAVAENNTALSRPEAINQKLEEIKAFHKSLEEVWEKLDEDFFINLTRENIQDYKKYIKEYFSEYLDPHTKILDKTEFEDMRGVFFGVGIAIRVDPDISKQRTDRLTELEEKYFPVDFSKPPYKGSSELELYKLYMAKMKYMERISSEFKKINRLVQAGDLGDKGVYLSAVVDMENSPAKLAGLTEKYNGWYIKSVINGTETTRTQGSNLKDIIRKIRGKNGAVVTLTLVSPDGKEEKIFNITRRPYNISAQEKDKSRLIEYKGKKIGYFKLTSFMKTDDEGSFDPYAIYNPLNELNNNGAKGWILDLRNNGGGFLRLGLIMADLFLEPNKLLLTEKFNKGEKPHYSYIPRFFKGPLVILINGMSASASEIVTIILKEIYPDKIYVVGTRSFGKGSVQEIRRIEKNSPSAYALKQTIAKYYSPNGVCVDGAGIAVDEEIIYTADPKKETGAENSNVKKEDPAIKRAVELIYSQGI